MNSSGRSTLREKAYSENTTGERVDFQDEYGSTGFANVRITRLETVYSGCNAPDIVVGDRKVAACNVGTSTAGTGLEAVGSGYAFSDAQTVCATGYHTPSANEWTVLLQEGYNQGLRSGHWSNASALAWNATTFTQFQSLLKLPEVAYWTSTSGSANSAFRFSFDDASAEVNGSYNQDESTVVRCFQDSSPVVPAGDVAGGNGTGEVEDFTPTGSCTTYTVPHA